MPDARSTYDESNEVWPYFIITVLGVILIPLTIGQLLALRGSEKAQTDVPARHAAFRERARRQEPQSRWKSWFVAIGWAAMAALIVFVRRSGDTTVVASPDVWDPYTILDLSTSAGMKEIKAAYRKLSLQFHPDKVKDVADAVREEIEIKYVEITKAYRALTDEVTRDNYLQYGHPDGPQPVTHGIALPAFLFNPTASVVFIVSYMLVFSLGVRHLVASYWSASQKRTKRGLLQATAAQFCELLVKDQPHFISRDRVLQEILSSPDVTESLGESRLTTDERLAKLNDYLHRRSPQDEEELIISSEVARLLLGLHDIASEFKSFLMCRRLIEMHRSVVQAVPFEDAQSGDLEQLRGIDSDKLHNGNLSPDQILAAVDDSRGYLPRLHLLSADFRVNGEEKVTVSSRVYLQVKFVVVPLGDKPPVLTNEEIDAGSNVNEFLVKPEDANLKQPELGSAVAPHFPLSVPVAWYAYIVGERDNNKILDKPYLVKNMDLHNLKLTKEQVAEGDDVVVGTINVPLSVSSPPEPGSAPFKVYLLSSAYFGTDIRTRAVMEVVAATAPTPPQDDDEQVDGDADEDEESDEEVEGLSDIDTSTEEEDNADEDEKK